MKQILLGLLFLAGALTAPGCEREIVEIETPRGELEVNETPGGGIEIERE